MAEIQVEHRTRSGAGKWVVVVLLVALLAAAGWYFLAGPGQGMLDRDGGAGVENATGAPEGDDYSP